MPAAPWDQRPAGEATPDDACLPGTPNGGGNFCGAFRALSPSHTRSKAQRAETAGSAPPLCRPSLMDRPGATSLFLSVAAVGFQWGSGCASSTPVLYSPGPD